MHLVLSVNVKSCKCVWPVHSSPSFGFLTIIIWKTRVTVNHGWLCDSLVLTGYFKAFTVWLVTLLYGLPLSFSSARGQRHVSVSLCSYSLWHWLCRFPRFQTNDMSFLSSQSSGSAQTREELQQALPSQALSLIRFVQRLLSRVISGSTADEGTSGASFIRKAWTARLLLHPLTLALRSRLGCRVEPCLQRLQTGPAQV